MKPLQLLISFLCLGSSLSATQPELTVLQQQYDKVLAERVNGPFETAFSELTAKFTTALATAAKAAQQAAKLDDVLAIQDDQKCLAGKLPLPADDEKTPESLKKLRTIYRDQLSKIEGQRAAALATILPGYQARLKELENTLTKAGRIEEAKEIRSYQEGLATAPVSTSPPTTPSAKPTPAVIPSGASKGKADPRKAAEWVLSLGGNISVRTRDMDVKVMKPQDLPKGKITLVRVQMNSHYEGYRPITDQDMQLLEGLDDLESLLLFELPVTDAGLAFIPSCSNLRFIETDSIQITGNAIAKWTSLKHLGRLNLANAREFRGGNFEYLKHLPIKELNVKATAVNDEDLLVIAKLKQLKKIVLTGTKVTDDGIAALKKVIPDIEIIRQ